MLNELFLGEQYHLLTDHVDFSDLRMLELMYCLDPQPLLKTLSTTYSGGSCALTSLDISISNETTHRGDSFNMKQDIENLFLSFKGLLSIRLIMSTSELVSKECIINHCLTLESLDIGTTDPAPVAYEVADLEAFLSSCPRLVALGLCVGMDACNWTNMCAHFFYPHELQRRPARDLQLRAVRIRHILVR